MASMAHPTSPKVVERMEVPSMVKKNMKPRWGKKVTDGEIGEGYGYATVDGNQNSG